MSTKARFRVVFVLLLAVLPLVACSLGIPTPKPDTPILNAASIQHSSTTPQPGDPIDGAQCDSGGHDNQYHVHDAVFVYVNGNQIPLPGALGQVPQVPCLYWLHTHSDSSQWGIIHMEAPLLDNSQPQNFTLQQFWNIWEQTSPSDFPQTTGSWTVYVDGQQVSGLFHTISLNPDGQGHHIIVMANNTDTSTLQLPDASTFDWHGF